jgi:DNA polymerase I-like protein with 3'-5' exonuclease and polymerase domains
VTRDPADVPCTLVNAADRLPELEKALADAERVAIDTEVPVSGPNAHELRVMSIALRAADGSERAFVVDRRDVDVTELAPILTGVTADAWNASFDARVVDAAVWRSADTTPGLTWWDAQLADALLHQGRSGFTWYHGLAWATEHYLGLTAEGKGGVQLSYTAADDLTADQVAYAAADAVETLWVADSIRAEIRRAGLERICDIELAARPFLDQMERTGLPFDWKGWQEELERIEQQNREVVGELAELTGGGQGTLFDNIVEPNWNPASDRQVRQALNRWAEHEVLAWTAHRLGQARLLTDVDSVTATVLREIGGDLCDALLRFRNLSKVLSTYGDSILEHLDGGGRLRPQYLQVVGTNTGRLASRNPNAQNFTPLMKPYVRPPHDDRVFVHADLSQAELRYLAQVANDEPLREAFARGDDVHATTAATMFGFDTETLERSDPDRFKHLRQIAKALNFGIAYGSGAAALSRSLTAEGSPTTVDEASKLLAQYRRTYPGTAAWAEARIAEIDTIREETSAIDWPITMRLARGFADVANIRRQFRRDRDRWPAATEIAELHPARHSDRHRGDRADLVGEIDWLLQYSAPVALVSGGEPFTFASRTSSGRRQQFNLHLDRLFLVASIEIIRNGSPELVAVRRRFEHDHSVVLHDDQHPLSDAELARPFEDRALRRLFLEAVAADVGDEAVHRFLGRSAKERVSAMVNAWRNAPIQGGVADVMLVAYADLHRRLGRYSNAKPVQTVHDSIVIECDVDDGPALVDEIREALERAMSAFCPDVAPKADVDIRRSLAEADVVPS